MRRQLPLFDELNATAADDEAFRLLWEDRPSDLPADPIFMVSHLMGRDVPPHAVGYASYSHFNRIFRDTYAITPAAYRAYAMAVHTG
ncbi:MAG: hypothetical protein Q4A07_08485 [Coriobacteriales bacterium]|nr:hypothetical protein [Coriobacteriales bacterium]